MLNIFYIIVSYENDMQEDLDLSYFLKSSMTKLLYG